MFSKLYHAKLWEAGFTPARFPKCSSLTERADLFPLCSSCSTFLSPLFQIKRFSSFFGLYQNKATYAQQKPHKTPLQISRLISSAATLILTSILNISSEIDPGRTKAPFIFLDQLLHLARLSRGCRRVCLAHRKTTPDTWQSEGPDSLALSNSHRQTKASLSLGSEGVNERHTPKTSAEGNQHVTWAWPSL